MTSIYSYVVNAYHRYIVGSLWAWWKAWFAVFPALPLLSGRPLLDTNGRYPLIVPPVVRLPQRDGKVPKALYGSAMVPCGPALFELFRDRLRNCHRIFVQLRDIQWDQTSNHDFVKGHWRFDEEVGMNLFHLSFRTDVEPALFIRSLFEVSDTDWQDLDHSLRSVETVLEPNRVMKWVRQVHKLPYFMADRESTLFLTMGHDSKYPRVHYMAGLSHDRLPLTNMIRANVYFTCMRAIPSATGAVVDMVTWLDPGDHIPKMLIFLVLRRMCLVQSRLVQHVEHGQMAKSVDD